MIDFDEEIKKFKPSLEVGDVEDAIYDTEMKDVLDLLTQVKNGENANN
ncbi:MAG: hypothetical protein K5656_06125 [Lachnospiraceae bacterium]|nr:hypothetical protein [Lachnospiraceae bacterium]